MWYSFLMKNRTYIKDLKSHVGEEATISGFVHTLRIQSKIIFMLVRDVTGIIQTVIEISNPEALRWPKISRTNLSSD